LITQGMFHRYVRVQMDGEINMQDRPMVGMLANLTEAEVKEIQDNYKDLLAEHGEPS